MTTSHGLGHCLGCYYAATRGHPVNPFVPATHIVAGTGLCGTCAIGVLTTAVPAPLITALLNITGRAPAPPPH